MPTKQNNDGAHTHTQHVWVYSLPLLAFSLIVISSSECFFLMLCAFSGQPDKLVQPDNFFKVEGGEKKNHKKLNISTDESERGETMQHGDGHYCLEIKWKTGDLTFCEWQTHYWHVRGRCSQAGDNGAVPVYWPSRQRAAHWWTTPSVFWQRADNCSRCDGMCIFPIYGPVRRIQLLDTYQKRRKQRAVPVVNLRRLLIHAHKNIFFPSPRHRPNKDNLTAQKNK